VDGLELGVGDRRLRHRIDIVAVYVGQQVVHQVGNELRRWRHQHGVKR